VGENINRKVDVRLVAATHRQLEEWVDQRKFRADLYYRIRGVDLVIPPLRERASDILTLARHFLTGEREKHKGGAERFTETAEALLLSYDWPGNVREMQNTIRAAHAIAGDARAIDVPHLPERLRKLKPIRRGASGYQEAVIHFRKSLIERSLNETRGNQNRAAKMLGMSRQALAYQIRELGILAKRK
jgi:transcriptional regulator with PAS, ATPase and Fis domain